MVNVVCPFCGASSECEEELFPGQHLVCPFCERTFTYRDNGTGNNGNYEESKFCGKCGAKMPREALFCPKCGQPAHVEAVTPFAETPTGMARGSAGMSSDVGNDVATAKINPKVQLLFKLVWWSIVVSAISTIAGCCDVKEYYPVGRVGYLLFEMAFLGVEVWLAMVIMRCKNWARITFVAMTLLGAVMSFRGDFGVVGFLGVGSMLICLYCAYLLCFNKDVIAAFLQNIPQQGTEAAMLNKWQCIAFWGASVLILALGVGWSVVYHGTNTWDRDCTSALVAGSASAREDMIGFVAERFADQGADYPQAKAMEYVDEYIEEHRPETRKSSGPEFEWNKVKPIHAYAAAKGIKVAVKGILLLIGAVVALVGGLASFGSKRK